MKSGLHATETAGVLRVFRWNKIVGGAVFSCRMSRTGRDSCRNNRNSGVLRKLSYPI